MPSMRPEFGPIADRKAASSPSAAPAADLPPHAVDGDSAPGAAAPVIALPKGGGAIRGIGETFRVVPSKGTCSLSIPVPISPGHEGFGPKVTLDYDSGSGNGPFGLGWTTSLAAISHRTDRGLPHNMGMTRNGPTSFYWRERRISSPNSQPTAARRRRRRASATVIAIGSNASDRASKACSPASSTGLA